VVRDGAVLARGLDGREAGGALDGREAGREEERVLDGREAGREDGREAGREDDGREEERLPRVEGRAARSVGVRASPSMSTGPVVSVAESGVVVGAACAVMPSPSPVISATIIVGMRAMVVLLAGRGPGSVMTDARRPRTFKRSSA
jgi:hypothetical protein